MGSSRVLKEVKCRSCGKSFTRYMTTTGCRSKMKRVMSDQGVYMFDRWLCNECWKSECMVAGLHR